MECPPLPPFPFPFTLPEAPGEYSPSCQCNVAHRGNHAASLASGCLLPAENATLALNHLTRSCCASLWEGFPHTMKPAPSWWGCTSAEPFPPSRLGNMHLCLYVNSARVEKDLRWMRRYPPTPVATFGFMSPVPSLNSAGQSEALRWDWGGHKRQSRATHGFIHASSPLRFLFQGHRGCKQDSRQPSPQN